MDYVNLGRTGLKASVMGLGGGGFSQLGLRTGGTPEQAVALVRRALELGVNLIDTAEAYRFCRHEPGLDVVLSGTGNIAHLETNARCLCLPPLPRPVQQRLLRTFARIDSISGQ